VGLEPAGAPQAPVGAIPRVQAAAILPVRVVPIPLARAAPIPQGLVGAIRRGRVAPILRAPVAPILPVRAVPIQRGRVGAQARPEWAASLEAPDRVMKKRFVAFAGSVREAA
jgi:hypothetical protein